MPGWQQAMQGMLANPLIPLGLGLMSGYGRNPAEARARGLQAGLAGMYQAGQYGLTAREVAGREKQREKQIEKLEAELARTTRLSKLRESAYKQAQVAEDAGRTSEAQALRLSADAIDLPASAVNIRAGMLPYSTGMMPSGQGYLTHPVHGAKFAPQPRAASTALGKARQDFAAGNITQGQYLRIVEKAVAQNMSQRKMELAAKKAAGTATPEEEREWTYLTQADPFQQMMQIMMQQHGLQGTQPTP